MTAPSVDNTILPPLAFIWAASAILPLLVSKTGPEVAVKPLVLYVTPPMTRLAVPMVNVDAASENTRLPALPAKVCTALLVKL